MSWFVKAFLKASLAWLALGVTFGVAMAAHPVWTVYRLAHVHALLLGLLSGLALSPHLALLAGTAFVGSYTTFSTWMLETHRLGEERQ